jgi:dipeptidyl aminopeptidase/acylaminoacyl peptidase
MDAVLSPDGSVAVFQVSEGRPGKTPDEDSQVTSLWRVDVAGGAPRRLTMKGVAASLPQFTPDGRTILFLSARDPKGAVSQVHRLPLDGGEAEAVTALEQGVSSFVLSPDGASIAFTALEGPPKPRGPHDHVRIKRLSYRLDSAPGYLQHLQHAIYVIPADGGDAKALTAHDGLFGAMAWSPDSREIAAVVVAKAESVELVMIGDLIVVDLDANEQLLVKGALITDLAFTTDGRAVAYIGAPDGNLSRQSQLFLVDREGGAPVSRTPGLDRAVGGGLQTSSPTMAGKSRLILTADGQGVIVAVGVGGESNLHQIALFGPPAWSAITSGPRGCKALARSGSLVLFAAEDMLTPSELFIVDLATGEERALTALNAEWRSTIAWPTVERLLVTSAPGVEIEGWVLKPAFGAAPYKTLLFIHGGPHGAYGCTFNEDMQEMAGAGYAVAFANPRGSTNYGDAFSTAIIGVWGRPETEDFNAFLDALIARGVADPNALGVTGVSGGGHLSGWLIGHTDRFKAAVPEQGVYNMFSMYGVSDAGFALISLEMGGPPHEQVQRYWELSPIAYAHLCKTPTLLIQGEDDVRCPMEQAEQFFTVLKLNGCEVELLRLKGCNHALHMFGPPPLRRTRMDAMKDWFGRHIP